MAKIDPAFQAAPFLGESSHDPIEFTRRQNLIKYQRNQQKQKESEKNISEGLDKLTLDLKDLYGQVGIDKVLEDNARTKGVFIELERRGANIFSPTTPREIKAYQAIIKAQEDTMKKVDVIKANKAILELDSKALFEDMKLSKEDRAFNHEETGANIEAAKKIVKEGGILENQGIFDNLLVRNIKYGDVLKNITDNKDFYEKPTVTQNIIKMPDGTKKVNLEENWTDEQVAENKRRAGIHYEGLNQSYKNAVTKIREKDPDPRLNVQTDKDYFIGMAVPPFRKKFLEKPVGVGSNFEVNLGGGKKINMQPGKLRPEPLPYGDRSYINSYTWPIPTTPITIPVGEMGSAQFLGSAWAPITKGGTVEATPYLYNPATKEFVFNVTSNQNAPWVQNNSPVSIPQSVIGDLADDFPIMVDGKKRKLKDIYPKDIEKPAIKLIGGKDLSGTPYIPKNK